MFGECHAHIIMNGVNYRQAIDMHKYGPDGQIIREHLKAYQDRGSCAGGEERWCRLY